MAGSTVDEMVTATPATSDRFVDFIGVNGIIMTLFLWHMTAYLIAILLLWRIGLGQQGDTAASWWIERPIWEFLPAVILVVSVRLFGRFERVHTQVPKQAPDGSVSVSS